MNTADEEKCQQNYDKFYFIPGFFTLSLSFAKSLYFFIDLFILNSGDK